jgi:hypothetical protein
MELRQHGFWATGTVRKNRKGFPNSLAGFPKANVPDRGEVVVRMHRSRKICAICWIDSKLVFLLSTACNPIDPNTVAGRWIGSTRVDFPTSPILLQYQQNMRGVDLVDQKCGNYTIQLWSHKWWHRPMLFVVDSSILNAYVIYVEDMRELGLPTLSRQLFHFNLGAALVEPYVTAARGSVRNLAPRGLHRVVGHEYDRQPCVVCGRRTRKFCVGCGGLFVHSGSCNVTLHTQPAVRARAVANNLGR